MQNLYLNIVFMTQRKLGNQVCVLSSKEKAFLSDKKFFLKYGFEVVDTVGNDYELLSLSFDGNTCFSENAKNDNKQKELTSIMDYSVHIF